MKSTRKVKSVGENFEIAAVKLHGFRRSEEQFRMPQEIEMSADFYDANDSWNQMLIKTMHNMRLSCQFFN